MENNCADVMNKIIEFSVSKFTEFKLSKMDGALVMKALFLSFFQIAVEASVKKDRSPEHLLRALGLAKEVRLRMTEIVNEATNKQSKVEEK